VGGQQAEEFFGGVPVKVSPLVTQNCYNVLVSKETQSKPEKELKRSTTIVDLMMMKTAKHYFPKLLNSLFVLCKLNPKSL
jgi:hypothetical protein